MLPTASSPRRRKSGYSPFALLLGAVYLVAFLCVSLMAFHLDAPQNNSEMRSSMRHWRPPAKENPPIPISPSPPPPPSIQWSLTGEEAAEPLWIRAGNRYLAVSAKGLVRPSASELAYAARFRPLAAEHIDGRAGWALRVENPSRLHKDPPQLVAMRADVPTFPQPARLGTLEVDTERFLVFQELNSSLKNLLTTATSIRKPSAIDTNLILLGGEGLIASVERVVSSRKSLVLRYPADQKPPSLVLDVEATTTAGTVDDEELRFTLGVDGGDGNGDDCDDDEEEGEEEEGESNHAAAADEEAGSGGREPIEIESGISTEDATSAGRVYTSSSLSAAASTATPPANATAADDGIVRIALGVAVRTHELTPPSDLPLIKVFVPSLVDTIRESACEAANKEQLQFTLYIGYDKGDPTYDDKTAMNGVSNALRAALHTAPNVNVIFVRYGGEDKGAPCWVWNKLYHLACSKHRDSYFYQLNDDLQLRTQGWARRFVKALRSSTPTNFGITGPLDLNNERLMTQSFLHCSHHLNALGFYYPWKFKNWYSDDWAAQLYGKSHTYWLTDVEVDHSLTRGPRYTISYEHAKVVKPEVMAGRRRLCEYLSRANGTDAEVFAPCKAEAEEEEVAVDEEEGEEEEEEEEDVWDAEGNRLGAKPKPRLAKRFEFKRPPVAQAPAVVQEGPEAKKARHQRLLDAVKEWDATRKAKSEEKREADAKKMAEEMLDSLRERD